VCEEKLPVTAIGLPEDLHWMKAKIWTEGSDKWFRKIERLSGIKYFQQFVDNMMSNMQPM